MHISETSNWAHSTRTAGTETGHTLGGVQENCRQWKVGGSWADTLPQPTPERKEEGVLTRVSLARQGDPGEMKVMNTKKP